MLEYDNNMSERGRQSQTVTLDCDCSSLKNIMQPLDLI